MFGLNEKLSLPALLLVLWGAVIGVGLLWMTDYSLSPGSHEEPLVERPSDTPVPFSEEKSTLVIFLHPRCPCTHPSVAAIERLMVRKHDMVLQPIFYLPGSKPETWARADYWDRVVDAGAHEPLIDVDGGVARQFHATTSGHAILFSVDGEVLYSGGITSGRVHEGDNLGLTTLTRVLEQVPVQDATFPVYGCSIVKKQDNDAGAGHVH